MGVIWEESKSDINDTTLEHQTSSNYDKSAAELKAMNKTGISDSSSKINSVIGFFDKSKIDETIMLPSTDANVSKMSKAGEDVFM